MTISNDNKSMHSQEMDYLTNGCHIRMFIEELRDCLECCNVNWWVI